ncbi:MAG: ABC transporter ATP-binding protein [Propionibacteriaceae bacterium]|jgi:iron complex transport system ATP-binding protein|nr:ABC transporter ATP-binding protein [Propionibacteriaceae bacterium]
MSLKISGIEFSHGSTPILKGIDIEVERGTFVALLGPNGAGKSTLAKILARIYEPARGSVRVGLRDLLGLKRQEHARVVAYVPQSAEVPFELTVAESVMLGRTPYIGLRPTAKDHAIVDAAIGRLGLGEFRERRLSQLSGGQAQRVLIARALAQEPEILLLDEPTSALDLRYQVETMQLIRDLTASEGVTALIAIHDLNMAAAYCDKIVLLAEGQVALDGPTSVLDAEVLSQVYGLDVEVIWREGYCEIRPASMRRLEELDCELSDLLEFA